jgi:hypothetical protein
VPSKACKGRETERFEVKGCGSGRTERSRAGRASMRLKLGEAGLIPNATVPSAYSALPYLARHLYINLPHLYIQYLHEVPTHITYITLTPTPISRRGAGGGELTGRNERKHSSTSKTRLLDVRSPLPCRLSRTFFGPPLLEMPHHACADAVASWSLGSYRGRAPHRSEPRELNKREIGPPFSAQNDVAEDPCDTRKQTQTRIALSIATPHAYLRGCREISRTVSAARPGLFVAMIRLLLLLPLLLPYGCWFPVSSPAL